MELVLFIGIQATGKSSFYLERFYRTHVRVNLDMLKTRFREQLLVKACVDGKTKFVVDNTNLTRAERGHYITEARQAGFRVVGYFFQSRVSDALQRNSQRTGDQRVPDKAIHGAIGRLELPLRNEGYDQLHFVRLNPDNTFTVEAWKD
jgi:predicted kinase